MMGSTLGGWGYARHWECDDGRVAERLGCARQWDNEDGLNTGRMRMGSTLGD